MVRYSGPLASAVAIQFNLLVNLAATLEMSPIKNQNAGKPIAVFVDPKLHAHHAQSPPSLSNLRYVCRAIHLAIETSSYRKLLHEF